MLSHDVYERARLARDARFDGLFYVAVRTTGIYCRPICPAVAPKRDNVLFFPTAAAAGEAGFRPCLRCRPECAPGTPAWGGTSTTVRRALKLISSGALGDAGVAALAERLGVTDRHLRRLFSHHLGASPLAVAHTQRLQFAKRLIDETNLSMTEVSAAAGYRSLRRFNDAFLKSYGRPPRDLRRVRLAQRRARGSSSPSSPTSPTSPSLASLSAAASALESPALTLHLPTRAPFDWPWMLRYFAGRGIPGVDCVSGDSYLRTVRTGDGHGIVELRPGSAGGLSLQLHGIETTALFDVVQRMRDLCDLDAPIDDIAAVLGRDEALAPGLQLNPGIRVPGTYDGFELTVRAVLGQQVSVKAANTLASRVAARYGEPLRLASPLAAELGLMRVFPLPSALRRARLEAIGLPATRAETLRRVAAAADAGDISFEPCQDVDAFRKSFTSIKGIGEWTAEYVAMRVLKYPDAFPASDLGLLQALRHPEKVTPIVLRRHAEAWRPFRAYAAILLWSLLASKRS